MFSVGMIQSWIAFPSAVRGACLGGLVVWSSELPDPSTRRHGCRLRGSPGTTWRKENMEEMQR